MARALLVIDMLRDFLDEDGALSIGDARQIIRNVAKRTEEWRSSGNPVIYILDRHLPDDAEFKMFPPHCLAGERGGEVVDELAPREGHQNLQAALQRFFGTDLDLTSGAWSNRSGTGRRLHPNLCPLHGCRCQHVKLRGDGKERMCGFL